MLVNATTTDDRGRSVEVIAPSQLVRSQSDLAAAPLLGKFLRDVIKAESRRISPTRVAVGVGGVGAIITVRIILARAFPGTSPLFGLLVTVGGISCLAVLMRIIARRTRGFTLASTAVSAGLCGSCGYSLDRIGTDADGCLVCPECGAAWKAFRVTRPYWKTDGTPFAPRFRAPWWLRWIGMVPTDKQLLGRDGRGSYFRIIDKHLRLIPPSRREPIGLSRLDAMRRAVGRIGLLWRCLIALFPFALSGSLFIGAFQVLKTSRGDDLWIGVMLMTIGAIMAVLTVITIRSHSFSSGNKRGAVMATFGVCGACSEELPLSSPEGDGLTNCTTCGAAWRVCGASHPDRCHSCGYALRGLPVGGDGAITCPECGGHNLGQANQSSIPQL